MRLSNEPTWCDLGDLWIWRHGKAHAYECGPDGVAVVTERTLKIWLADEANTVEHMRNYLSALLPEGEEL